MKVLKTIPSTKVVSIDIETVRITRTLAEAGPDVKIAFTYKFKNEGVVISDDFALEQLWVEKAALYAEFSKICSVSLAYLNRAGDSLVCRNITESDEVKLLTELNVVLTAMQKADPLYRLLGHSSKLFDYPFICKRMLVNGIALPGILDSTNMKPWEMTNLDTNELWKMGGLTGSSLVAMCVALGVPISKDEMAGEDVGEFFYAGKLALIGQYCDKDTVATFNCFRRFKAEPIFRFEDVVYLGGEENADKQVVAEEIPQMPCLNQLYLTKDFSDHVKAEVTDRFLAREKKVMKKEWGMLEALLCDLYVSNEMFKADKPEVVASKREEVKEFVNQLTKTYTNASKKTKTV